jgi:hypothetical protein
MTACPLCDSDSGSDSLVNLRGSAMVGIRCPTCGGYGISTVLVQELKADSQWDEFRKRLSEAISWAVQRQRVYLETVRDVTNLNAAFARFERNQRRLRAGLMLRDP